MVKTHGFLHIWPFHSLLHHFKSCFILVFTISLDLVLETFTIWAQFPVILAIWTKNGPKLPSKFAYPPSFDCLLQKSCPRQRLLNCTTRKNIKFCTRNSRKQNFVPDPPLPLKCPWYGTLSFCLFQLHCAICPKKFRAFKNCQVRLKFGIHHLWIKI